MDHRDPQTGVFRAEEALRDAGVTLDDIARACHDEEMQEEIETAIQSVRRAQHRLLCIEADARAAGAT